jgi:alpha-beta hydrolase superfamily lysophospholipase
MNIALRGALWMVVSLVPGVALTRGPVQIMASDNRDALLRLGQNKLTIKRTRFDALGGLVDLMDAALEAAPLFRKPSLFQYGGRDELVPKAATAFTWRALPRGGADGPMLAYYPDGYHLLLRDLGRAAPIGDIIAWVRDRAAPLPSGADRVADAWLEAQS